MDTRSYRVASSRLKTKTNSESDEVKVKIDSTRYLFIFKSHAHVFPSPSSSPADLGRVSIHSGVKLIKSKVVGIDGEEKFVRLKDGTRAAYDLLILTPGRQFFVPMPLGISRVNNSGWC